MGIDKNKKIVGVDLGGTTFTVGIMDFNGNILSSVDTDTPVENGPSAVMGKILDNIDLAINEAKLSREDILGVGLGAPGILDVERGINIFSPNLKWHNVDMVTPIKDYLNVPVFIENDVRVAALGERRFGAGKGRKYMIFIALGTGIGSGIIINGELFRGSIGGGGEIGHMVIDSNGPKCNCGNYGCFESLAAGPSMVARAEKAIKSGLETKIFELAERNIGNITPAIIYQAAKLGDKVALDVFRETSFYLGLGLVTLTTVFNPECIIIGGGIAKSWDILMPPAIQMVKTRSFPGSRDVVEIIPSQLGDSAGMIGACVLAIEKLEKEEEL
ncbi:MAG TPA: ROK family glucokinase [bacterium]|jgi:glucokinase|nr:ROK family glucokinase [Dictyoglomota bacterium]HOK29239.1 ROK family glucokinase [bacterium]HOL54426.1 ROK family glucokinase [bacterium]HON72042.1 ROK family glucokinase [bacterium]HPC77608.1 ROK family glucokinase [bacterium]